MASSQSGWQVGSLGRLRVGWAERPPADEECLHPRERRWLRRLDQRPERRADWIAGRLGLALLLPRGTHVLADLDGAPSVVGATWAASVSHEDGWVAVAARAGTGRVGIDVVPDRAAPVAARALARARVRGGDAAPPGAVWAALECAAKLRGVGVAVLLDRHLRVEARGGALHIHGLSRPARVWLRRLPGEAQRVIPRDLVSDPGGDRSGGAVLALADEA